MLTMSQFAAKIGKSRQRVHQLMREGRITPAPKLIGSYYLVAANARLTSVNGKRKV
jgi:hypothetical protein